MKSKKWINVFLITLIGVLLAFQFTIASASSKASPEEPPDITIKPSLMQKNEVSDFYNQAYGLAEKFATDFKSEPGDWYHWSVLISEDPTIKMVYPDGSEIPATTVHESWYTLNEQGMKQDGVYLVKDLEGLIIQEVVYRDNIAYNLTFPEIAPSKMSIDKFEPQALFDFDYVKNLRNAIDTGKYTTLKATSITDKNKSTTQFTITQEYQKPVQTVEVPAPIVSVSTTLNFDPETGASPKIETSYRLSDNKELTSSIEVIVLEKLTILPEEIQHLVKQPL
jgi:hypothetical protein